MHLNKVTADLTKAPHSKLIASPLEVSQAKRQRGRMNFSEKANPCLITLQHHKYVC